MEVGGWRLEREVKRGGVEKREDEEDPWRLERGAERGKEEERKRR